MTGNKPTLIAYSVKERAKGKTAIWTRIGAAWPFESGQPGCESARPLTPYRRTRLTPTPHIVSAATHSRFSGRTGVNLGL
jgi:hypothetical protein